MAADKDGGVIEYDRLKATLALDGPVTSVPLVSARRAQALRKLGISSVRDLLSSYPRRYIDMSHVATISRAPIGSACTIKAQVHEAKLKKPKRYLKLTEVTLVDGTGTLIVTAFRQPWLAEQLKPGMMVAVSGKVEFSYGYKRMTNPYIEQLEGDGMPFSGLIIPVHPLTGEIKGGMMRRLMQNALVMARGAIDPLPLFLRLKYRLMSRQNAFECIHFPHTMEEQRQARRRLAYEEVLLLELELMRQGSMRSKDRQSAVHIINGPKQQALAQAVPFELTDEQDAAKKDILAHMGADESMNHLLLGDVGTGKTIVSAFALAAVADTGTQALFMAPTEILAMQHAQNLGPLLEQAGISWGLLTGSTPDAEREGLLERLADGSLTVLFGTHALLEPDVAPIDCSLVVIDEQQRFGVNQRSTLIGKGSCPDALYLTATPIPRSLALALFGNLTLSYITQRPKNQAPRMTEVHTLADKGVAYDAGLEALKRGEQVYVVCPLVGVRREEPKGEGLGAEGAGDVEYAVIQIEDEDDMQLASLAAAEQESAFLQSKVFVDYKVGLVHGKMPSAQKQQVMDDFREGNIQVLVATTVIEVGVDVPNATVMIVEDADRFGLSQLHQLRGRVGRGDLPGQMHLISGTKNETALERLGAMEKTEDGFGLASYDLSLRREGDILGNRQHGASLLKLVNVVRDKGLIEAAWADAKAILEEDPELESDLYRPLAREAAVVYRHEQEVIGG